MRAYDVTKKLQDLRALSWDERLRPSTTQGSFPKAVSGTGKARTYYKLSNYDSYRGVFGHECVNELLASRLLRALGFPHVEYRLIHAVVHIDGEDIETWLCSSKSFRPEHTQTLHLDTFYDLYRREGESPLDFCERYGWGTYAKQVMLTDYLIINRDRHGANIEVIKWEDGHFTPAPLFDNGLSFVWSCFDDENEIAAFDPLFNKPVNNYLGSRFLQDNLQFVPKNLAKNPFGVLTKEKLFAGLDDVVSEVFRDKIWEILTARWDRYESL